MSNISKFQFFVQILLSRHAEKKRPYIKKNKNFFFVFFYSMVGTFCATCTVTGRSCRQMKIELESWLVGFSFNEWPIFILGFYVQFF